MESIKSSVNPSAEIRLGNFVLRDKDLFVIEEKDEKVKEKYLANASKVKNVIRRIEDGDILIEIEFYSFGKWVTMRVPRGKLSKNELTPLLNKGMDIAGYKTKPVLQFLDYHEKTIEPTYYHKELGWFLFEDELTFRLQKAIQLTKEFSNYEGFFTIKPKGSEEKWMQIIKDEVIGYPSLEMVLSASFAAPVAALLNITQKADVDSLLFHIVGTSTIGKTTAAMVAVSPFGNPSVSHNGLIQSFNGTPNALQALISGNYGVPIVFDETSMNEMDKASISSFVYKLAQNKEKLRLNKESELRETLFWCTVIFFTGESSMLAKANNNEGLRVRLFEFKDMQWTKDGKHSDRLKIGLLNNYGHAAPKYVEHLLKTGVDEIEKKWNELKSFMLEKMPDTRFKARISGKFATILTGAYYANEALGLGLSIDTIADFLVEQELRSMDERELAPKFYNDLKNEIIRYRRNFKLNNTPFDDHHELWGKIEAKNGQTYCYILPNIYEKFTKELGYTDSDVLLKELKRSGVIVNETNKNTTRKVIFPKGQEDQREKVLGVKKYLPKGDPTICIKYDGNILGEFGEGKRQLDERLRNYDPNSSKKVSPKGTINQANRLFDEDK